MPRKFRLSVHRKNEFRKKRANKIAAKQDPQPVPQLVPQLPMISIAKEVYYNAPVPSLFQLKEQVQKTQILPQGEHIFQLLSFV